MKLFQIKNVHNEQVLKDTFAKKNEAKKARDTLNKEKHEEVDYKDYTKHTFVVTYGPDHPRYQAWFFMRAEEIRLSLIPIYTPILIH